MRSINFIHAAGDPTWVLTYWGREQKRWPIGEISGPRPARLTQRAVRIIGLSGKMPIFTAELPKLSPRGEAADHGRTV